MEKYVWYFHEGSKDDRMLLGGKGANLAEMTRLGLPVPPGFTITTSACLRYLEEGEAFLDTLKEELEEKLKKLEQDMGKKFGSVQDPLLVSVRSGAAVSMPGMMDTVLNLGLNDNTVEGLEKATGSRWFALDCYRRLIQMYAEVVMGVASFLFSQELERIKEQYDAEADNQLTPAALEELIHYFKKIVVQETKEEFPQDPQKQLLKAIIAVLNSWNNRRAVVYRDAHAIPHDLGTAVNIQAMVFGNRGEKSGTGVLFTRDPSTGEKKLYGEFLMNAQGEDVVAGIRTPLPLDQMKEELPKIYNEIEEFAQRLEKHYKDIQDVEFTIEEGRLFILKTRNGERTAAAAIKIAVDLVEEGVLTKDEAILRVPPSELEKILHKQVELGKGYEVLARGLPASPGAASGKAVFNPDLAEKLAKKGERVILIALETTPDDIHGMIAAQGLLTTRGGMTSHAAVVARGMGKPAVCGCEALRIDTDKGQFSAGNHTIKNGEYITINGSTGEVIKGDSEMKEPELTDTTEKLLKWADERRKLKIRANADNGEDAQKARDFGAEGIGLCRTEHMFMGKDRMHLVRQLILGETEREQEAALENLLPLQQNDFREILQVMEGLPVTVRLLDPPLHEFLPDLLELQEEILRLEKIEDVELAQEKRELFRKTRNMSESNPMLGLRGCRLGIIMPSLYEMQVKALFRAGTELAAQGKDVIIEVMIPLVSEAEELAFLQPRLEKAIEEEFAQQGTSLEYQIGTMIELPRACVTADDIAQHADFFSFGTNDLTQTTYGFSRDDAEGKFLHYYLEKKILADNPFISLDKKGTGRLVKIAVEEGRKTRKGLKIGICGEHGGDPGSIEFCHNNGLDYVSCSPYRVPVARLAAAAASIRE